MLVVALFAVLLTPVEAQVTRDKMKGGSSHWGGTRGNLFFGFGASRNHFGYPPILNRFLFSGHRPTFAGTGNEFLFGGYRYHSPFYSQSPFYSYSPFGAYGLYGHDFFGYQTFGPMPAMYNSALFIEEWKDRDPIAGRGSESQVSTVQQSILLADGMDEEQVMRAVGSPVQRVQLGERTVWKYSGYSLLFEGGKLKEIR